MSDMADTKVIFHGSVSCGENCFLFYFENIAGTRAEGEESARTFIKYICGTVFQFYFNRFIALGKLIKDSKTSTMR